MIWRWRASISGPVLHSRRCRTLPAKLTKAIRNDFKIIGEVLKESCAFGLGGEQGLDDLLGGKDHDNSRDEALIPSARWHKLIEIGRRGGGHQIDLRVRDDDLDR